VSKLIIIECLSEDAAKVVIESVRKARKKTVDRIEILAELQLV